MKVLNVAEKPSVAKGISEILSNNRFQWVKKKNTKKKKNRFRIFRIFFLLLVVYFLFRFFRVISSGSSPTKLPPSIHCVSPDYSNSPLQSKKAFRNTIRFTHSILIWKIKMWPWSLLRSRAIWWKWISPSSIHLGILVNPWNSSMPRSWNMSQMYI